MDVAVREKPKFELLSQFPWKWALFWVVVPNLAIMAMWTVGGPSMAGPIFYCGMLAIVASQSRHLAVRWATLVAIYALLLCLYITKSFNLGIGNFIATFEFAHELDIFASPEYLAAGVVLAISLGFALRHARKPMNFNGNFQKLLALVAVALVVNADNFATAGTRGTYKMSAPAGTPIDSAVIQAGITPKSVKARNLVVVIVESWGVPLDPYDKALHAKTWDHARWSGKYRVTEGTSPYYGSTTNAELREWCSVWSDHYSYDFSQAECLPRDFADAGFTTTAMHSFDGDFFERKEWYPALGFQQQKFQGRLRREGAEFCNGVFPGACDRDVPRLITKQLAGNPDKRNLVYWLTVNAHLPVLDDAQLGTKDCALGDARWNADFSMLCRNLEVHRQVADALTAEVMAEDFPQSDILIVGDHMPPFFPRNIRTRFDTANVPWIFLENREAIAAAVEEPNGTNATGA